MRLGRVEMRIAVLSEQRGATNYTHNGASDHNQGHQFDEKLHLLKIAATLENTIVARAS